MSFRTWAVEVLVIAVAFSLFFGLVIGKRGLDLVVFVVVLSLFLPSVMWFTQRARAR
ncbi:MAG TPA: hypothetical protein VJQ08_03835 [Candidatus Dormibacteraeota bacterium]|nr:hypothetical protein [Candidatus Dormibacteraeota bacterium]